jgi:hypothetical protein
LPAVVYRYVNYQGRAVPLVPVGIRGGLHWGRIWAYADSGAAYSLFDDSVANLLGIDWPTGRPRAATVGTGAMIRFYLHPVTLQLRRVRINMDIGFSAELRIGFNVLGLDVFDQFNQVIFDSHNRCLTFQR